MLPRGNESAAPLFGETFVDEFGPLRFRTMRDQMVNGDPDAVDVKGNRKPRKSWSRPTVNRQAKRIRQIFRWSVSWEMVPTSVVTALETVPSLAIGETTATEPEPRLAVPQSDVDAVRKELKPKYRDMLDLQLLTGARPGEILKLTGEMLERRKDCWIAELHEHKSSRKGKRRFLVFNETAQAILQRYLKDESTERLFPGRRDNF